MAAFGKRDFSGIAVETTLQTGITNVDTSFVLDNVTGWPGGGVNGDFFVQIEDEVIRCSSRSGTTIQVAVSGRGASTSSAVSHVAGVPALLIIDTTDFYEANLAVVNTIGRIAAVGDMLRGSAPNQLEAFDAGTENEVLQIIGGLPDWGPLGAAQITDGSVGSVELATGAVVAGKIGTGGISASNQFVADVVDAAAIAPLTITDAEVATANKDGVVGTPSLRTLGTGALQATAGNDTRLTDSRVPTGGASGTLNGTYPSPGVNTDGATLETNASTLRVKALGITTAHIAAQAWSSYSPGWATTGGGGSQPSIGNGTLTGRYIQIGKTVHVNISLTFGSTTNGGSTEYSFTLPVAAVTLTSREQLIRAKAFTTGTFNFMGHGLIGSGATTVVPYFPASASNCSLGPARNADSGGQTTTGVPVIAGAFTWTNGTNMILHGTYECA
jgi:hypothetical protein